MTQPLIISSEKSNPIVYKTFKFGLIPILFPITIKIAGNSGWDYFKPTFTPDYVISLRKTDELRDLIISCSPGEEWSFQFAEFWIIFEEEQKNLAEETFNKLQKHLEDFYDRKPDTDFQNGIKRIFSELENENV